MPNKVQTPTNPVNEAHKSYKQSRTTFPTSYAHYTTELYGYLQPFFAMEGVEGDTIPLNSHQEVRTPTLRAPLMSKIVKNKDYYSIPMRAILPKTWEQIYTNPTQGDDIPEDANCFISVRNLLLPLNYLMSFDRGITLSITQVERVIKVVMFSESILSDGSLLAKMGCHLSPLFRWKPDLDNDLLAYNTFDQWFDAEFIPWFRGLKPVIVVGTTSYALEEHKEDVTAVHYVSLHRLLSLMRDYADFALSLQSGAVEDEQLANLFLSPAASYALDIPGSAAKINISRVLAYQIVCYHFYTNDKVDPIFTAQLYRGLMSSVFGAALSDTREPNANNINSIRKYYSYNGELLEYDIFSNAVLDPLLTLASGAGLLSLNGSSDFIQYGQLLDAMRNIFGFNRSLRFGDYFTGARPSPLAVGDINTAVVNSEVNALDMTKSLLMQRFLNSVNRVGRKFSSYVQMLSGRLPASTPTNPVFLAHTADIIGSYEVENTAENQGKIVTNMRDGSSKFAFSYDVNEPCIVIGLSWFEVQRIYSQTIDRHFFHKTRFDMFNKFFQYGGDQAIYLKELDPRSLLSEDSNFAYTLRYMEYKQRIPICSGGFRKFLPGYAFLTDSGIQTDSRISPEFIRSRVDEFDQFFSSLTGYSLGSYFHFIVKYVNECDAERQMEYAPSML